MQSLPHGAAAVLSIPEAGYPLLEVRMVLLFKAARGHHVVDARAIIAVAANERYALLHMANGKEMPVFHTLAELGPMLNCGKRTGDLLFMRVHKSTIAALHHLHRIDGHDLELPLDRKIKVSREHWAEVLKVLSTIQPL